MARASVWQSQTLIDPPDRDITGTMNRLLNRVLAGIASVPVSQIKTQEEEEEATTATYSRVS